MTNPAELLSRPWLSIPATGPVLRPAAAAKYLGLSRSKLYALIADNKLPRPIRLSEGTVGIPQPWLDACIAARVSDGDAK